MSARDTAASAPSASSDERWMRRAIELAKRGTRAVRPNPLVGCVLVVGGEAVGEGFHAHAGGPHAEAVALAEAGPRAAGCTAYVTLQPCNHTGKTKPCAGALIAAGVRRVVIGSLDPNPTAGGGIRALRAAGIEVTTGVLTDDCDAVAEVFLANVLRARPHFRLKLAATLDGRTAAYDGTSQWITNDACRDEVHALRAAADAVLVGSGTVLADDPLLSVRRIKTAHQPLRVVLDRRLRTGPERQVCAPGEQRTLIVTTLESRSKAGNMGFAANVEVVGIGDGGPQWLGRVAAELLNRGICSVFCEPGSTLAGALIRAGLIDRLDVMVGAKLVGKGRGLLSDIGVETIGAAMGVRLDVPRLIGGDVWLSGTLQHADKTALRDPNADATTP